MKAVNNPHMNKVVFLFWNLDTLSRFKLLVKFGAELFSDDNIDKFKTFNAAYEALLDAVSEDDSIGLAEKFWTECINLSPTDRVGEVTSPFRYFPV